MSYEELKNKADELRAIAGQQIANAKALCRKACKKEYRQTHRKQIKAYMKIYMKKYYPLHNEIIKERSRKYRQAHREEVIIKGREYWQANREKNRERAKKYRQSHKRQMREYRQNHKEKLKIQIREYRQIHKEKLNMQRRGYYQTHKKEERLRSQKRKSLMRGGGKLSIKIIQQVYEDNIKQHGTLTCYLCLQPIPFGKDHLEHKIPLIRGGTNEYNNLAIACQNCNYKKHIKTEEEYKKEILL